LKLDQDVLKLDQVVFFGVWLGVGLGNDLLLATSAGLFL
jgi:hypothetical protein